jgi:gamma-glutamyltranspeptidase/glutathione hydrolase
MTTTINTTFGSGIMVPGTGIILNDEMDDFALPGVANAYGLTGGEANAIVPGKRPQSSMSPTIVLDGDRPVLAVGASGGPLIISAVIQTTLNVVADGQSLRNAVAAPRLHDAGRPPRLLVEPAMPAPVRTTLTKIGHQLTDFPAIAAASAAGLDATGKPTAAGDRRKDGGEAVVE